MSNTKFTSGPWVARTDLDRGAAVYSEDGFKLVHIDGAVTAINEDYANAHLIAAAPELYEALERFTWLSPNEYREMAGWIEAAKAALKKAQGGTE